jgi:hypothetical protein
MIIVTHESHLFMCYEAEISKTRLCYTYPGTASRCEIDDFRVHGWARRSCGIHKSFQWWAVHTQGYTQCYSQPAGVKLEV